MAARFGYFVKPEAKEPAQTFYGDFIKRNGDTVEIYKGTRGDKNSELVTVIHLGKGQFVKKTHG